VRLLSVIGWLLGAVLLAALLVTSPLGQVVGTVERLGWWLALVIAFHAAPLLCDVLAWRLLFERVPPLLRLLRIRWIGEAANGLLPIPHLGELLRVKLPYDSGSDLADAGASVLADVTLGLVSQVLFIATGLILFGLGGGAETVTGTLATGGTLAVFTLGFYIAQRSRFFSRAAEALGRSAGSAWHMFDGAGIRRVEDALHVVYADRWAVGVALVWRLVGWFVGAGEVWLIPWCLGLPISFADAIILESLSHGARAAAFIVPGGLGVQDGTLMVLSAQLGIGAELGLVIALVKRLRELALGLPALAVAWTAELRRWQRRRCP
jgi:putative membrane protein